jgi:polar amino acid transport system substrate-binding protein
MTNARRRAYCRILLNTVVAFAGLSAASANAVEFLTEENYPFSFTKSGKVVGASVDVVAEAAKRAGITANIKAGDWLTIYKRSQTEPETCIFSIARLPDRENLFKWVGVIAQNKWSIFAAPTNDTKLAKLEDVRKYKLGAVAGDAKATYVRNKSISLYREFDTLDKGMQSLYAAAGAPGKIDFFIAGAYEAPRAAKALKLASPKDVLAVHEVNLSLACSTRTANDTVTKLQDALEKMRADGTMKRLSAPDAYLKD